MSKKSVISRPWDGFDGYLIDIDGTLLNCQDAVHYFAFCDALSGVAGRRLNLDGVVTHGNVDEGILRDAFVLGGVDEATWRGQLTELRERIGEQVERQEADFEIQVLPGARAVLEHLVARGAVLSTATGNLARVGRAKLRRCDLLRYFALGGWSDGCESRVEVFDRAVTQLRERLGAGAILCVVGDTPADVAAAHACGLEVIAVSTGIYDFAALEATRPEVCLRSLVELV